MEARKILDHDTGTIKGLSKERVPEVIEWQKKDLKLFSGFLQSQAAKSARGIPAGAESSGNA